MTYTDPSIRKCMKYLYLFPLILATLGLVFTSILTFGHLNFSWNTMQPATCMPNCFCEALHIGSNILQPVNTGSSLAFVLVSVLLIIQVRRDFTSRKEQPINSFTTYWFYPLIYSIALMITGFGSAFYHASLTFWGQFVDVLGMNLTTTFMLSYAFHRLWQLKNVFTLLIYALLNIPLTYLLIVVPEFRRSIFGLFLILAIAAEFLILKKHHLRIQSKFLVIGLILFALAYIIWILDNSKLVCMPNSLIQGHAIWHITGAIATWLLYQYYRSEERLS